MNAVKDSCLPSVSRKPWTTPAMRQMGVIAKIDVPHDAERNRLDAINPPFAIRRHRVELVRRDAAAHS
jgi:hypothetical protein